jgi:hypothetical protein
LEEQRSQKMKRAHLVLPALNGQLMRSPYRLFCLCGEVVEWWHI